MDSLRPVPDLRELLSHATWLRELVAPLLAGSDAVEDVLQETFTAALEKPPRAGTRWRAWLARVAWNRAQRTRRETHRRTAREREAARSEAEPAADRVVAEFELQAKVAAAVLALEPNARRVILLRFYEGLPPRAIASELGVPVTTVKSCIQRGLEKLREQLARELGEDWRGALAPLVAPGTAAVSAATSTFAFSTVLLGVAMQAKLAIGLFVLAGLGAVGWIATQRDPAPIEPPRTEIAVAAPERAEPVSQVDRRVEAPSAGPTEPALPNPAAANTARISGRCVDESGAPLSGVEVRLAGEPFSKMQAVQRGKRVPDGWKEPAPIVTTAAGTFAFEVEPVPFELAFHITATNRVALDGEVSEMTAGEHVQLGDVMLSGGCAISGIVRDPEGKARGDLQITLELRVDPSQPQAKVRARPHLAARVRGDGSFAFLARAAPGVWNLGVIGESPGVSRVLEIAADQRELYTEVRLAAAFEGRTISGVVVDELGAPIAGARVSKRGGSSDSAVSTKDGTWSIKERTGDFDADGTVTVQADGFEPGSTEGPVAWGTRDVRLVLVRGVDVQISVTSAETGEPIERFDIRLIADRTNRHRGGSSFGPGRGSERTPNAGGILALRGLPRGAYRLQVDPTDRRWARSAVREISVADGMPPIEVTLQRASRLKVRVEDLEGQARAGSRVTLVERGTAGELSLQSPIEPFDTTMMSSRAIAFRIDEGRTDEKGFVELRGPSGRPLALLIVGPSHLPELRRDVQIADDTLLVVQVGSGARILGRLEPVELVTQMRKSGGTPLLDAELGPAFDRSPFVSLARKTGTTREEHPPRSLGRRPEARTGEYLTDDGRFVIEGIPPGDWELELHFASLMRFGASTGISTRNTWVQLASLSGLSEGETREVALSRPDLQLAQLSGLVVLDGEPFAHRALQILGRGVEDGRRKNPEYVETDGEGRFEVLVQAGTYQPQCRIAMPTTGGNFDLPAVEEVTLTSGQKLDRDFHVESGEVRLCIVDAEGQPVPELISFFRHDRFDHQIDLPRTDEEGRTSGRMLRGSWTLLTRAPGKGGAILELGRVTVPTSGDASAHQELRLPVSWTGR